MLPKQVVRSLFAAALLSTLIALPVFAQKSDAAKPTGVPVLWRNPGDVSQRNLTFGPGSAEFALEVLP